MNSTPSLRRAVLVLLALAAALATASCVNLPANTTVSVVGNPAKGGSGADVRIWPQAPQRNAKPEQIVEGFLQTAASDPSNVPIAQDYLTGEALTSWHQNRVVVFSDVSSPALVQDGSTHIKVQVIGTEIATVSDNGAYQQIQNPVKDVAYVFGLTGDTTKGYRIDKLPGTEFGVLLTQEAFRANYAAYYLYYLNHDKPSSSMIPVPNYQRSQAGDAATAQNLVNALVTGPPDAVAGIASLAASAVTPAGPVTISPNNVALVPIKSPNDCTKQGRANCELLADELAATFSSLASVNSVTLVDARGTVLVQSSSVDSVVSRYHLAVSPAKSTFFYYYLDSKSAQVDRFDGASAGANSTSTEPVGPATRKYSQIAVSNVTVGDSAPQPYVALVDDKRTKLYVSTPGSTKDTAPVYVGTRISSLSWDAFGRLWFLDTNGASVSLHRLDATAPPDSQPEPVTITGDGGTINRIAIAPDGLRLAVSYYPAGSTVDSVVIAMVADTGPGVEVNLSFGIEQPVVDGWTTVLDIGWHGSQALAVLGSASLSLPNTVSELNSDGSPVISAADLNPVTVNPPTGTNNIDWTGSTLLAVTQTGTGASTQRQIEQYSFANGTWAPDANGFSPTYVN